MNVSLVTFPVMYSCTELWPSVGLLWMQSENY